MLSFGSLLMTEAKIFLERTGTYVFGSTFLSFCWAMVFVYLIWRVVEVYTSVHQGRWEERKGGGQKMSWLIVEGRPYILIKRPDFDVSLNFVIFSDLDGNHIGVLLVGLTMTDDQHRDLDHQTQGIKRKGSIQNKLSGILVKAIPELPQKNNLDPQSVSSCRLISTFSTCTCVFCDASSPYIFHIYRQLQIHQKMSVAETEKPRQDPNDPLDRKTIFVRSIPLEATSDELSEYFSQFVPVKHAVVVTDEEKKSRGFGFVSFTIEEDTLTALVEAKKHKFQNRFLRVDIAKRRDRKGKRDETQSEEPPKNTREPVEKRKARLIIRNLPWSCKDPATLRNIFQKYGAVHDAYIPTKKGGLMKGFAFVTMKKNTAAEKAVKESVGLKIDGREVAVDLAVEKLKWEQIQEEEKEREVPGIGRERVKEEGEDENEKKEDEKEEDEKSDEKNSEADSDSDSESESDSDDFDELNDVSDAEEKPREKQNKQEAYSIFVRNIPYDADKDSLKEHFSSFGPVKYALPVIDKVTGLAKGSAFVAFNTVEAYTQCVDNAPSVSSTSMLISDDVAPEYVYQGRILSIVSTVDRDSALRLAERNLLKRKEEYGIETGDKDKRNLFLLNEGRITENSKLAQFISATDMELREKSYKLRVQQLNKNPTLHLSLTRLAIRNLPRAMTGKALKALGRKAVVQFATEVKEEKRQPLLKEEVNRSIKYKHDTNEKPEKAKDEEEEDKKKKNKKQGVVKQAKVIMEVKGTGETGRSRGYGFVEYRDHKAALMGLRWLNAHEVSASEILEGLDEKEKKLAATEGINRRKLIVEFAIENAQVVKRRRETMMVARHGKRKREEGDEEEEEKDAKRQKKRKGPNRKGNMNKGARKDKSEKIEKSETKDSVSENVKNIIGRKRKMRKSKK